SIILVYYPGLLSWSNVLVYYPGLMSWSIILVYYPGLLSWSNVLVYYPGLLSWSIILVYYPGLLSWSNVLVYYPGLLSWSVILVNCHVIIFDALFTSFVTDNIPYQVLSMYTFPPPPPPPLSIPPPPPPPSSSCTPLLQTVTVQAGQRLELDCLGEVMEAMGRFSFRVSWRHARGVVTTDDSLLGRWDAPRLDRLVLDPVREEDAGTYRCDVQDTDYRRVKRLYLGLKVLPPEALRLDFPSALARWDDGDEDSHGNIIVVKDDEDLYGSTVIKDIVLKSLWVAVAVFFFGIFSFYLTRQVKIKFLFTMTAYTGQTQTTLGQRTRVSVVTPLALRCSALDHCTTREPIILL
ncbi:unnamed protein product, partial [Oncorhynchus mykiss]